MPSPTPERLLATTARSTFESLALLYAEFASADPAADAPAGDRIDALGPGAVVVRVPFAGVARGEAIDGVLVVAVGRTVAAALAENMLGGTPGDDELRDAVGEFANVVCGHVLSAAGGPAAVFRLGAPEPVIDVGVALGGAWCAWLDVEGGPACVALDAPGALFANLVGDVAGAAA